MMESVYQTHRHAMSRNAQAGDYDVRTALNTHTEQANLLLYTMIFWGGAVCVTLNLLANWNSNEYLIQQLSVLKSRETINNSRHYSSDEFLSLFGHSSFLVGSNGERCVNMCVMGYVGF